MSKRGATRHNILRHGAAYYDTVQHGAAYYSTVQQGGSTRTRALTRARTQAHAQALKHARTHTARARTQLLQERARTRAVAIGGGLVLGRAARDAPHRHVVGAVGHGLGRRRRQDRG